MQGAKGQLSTQLALAYSALEAAAATLRGSAYGRRQGHAAAAACAAAAAAGALTSTAVVHKHLAATKQRPDHGGMFSTGVLGDTCNNVHTDATVEMVECC